MHQRNRIPRFPLNIVAVLLLVVCVSTCKSTESTGTDTEAVNIPDLETLYWERVERSRMNFAEADVTFMVNMIAHHAQALIMSGLAPQNGASAEVQRLAARILSAQKDEISTMQQWLRDRGQPVPEVHIDGLHLMIHGVDDHLDHSGHMDMPGMLSQGQLEELEKAREAEFDRLFLEYMIEHHEGAVIMVDNLFSAEGAAQDREAFRLASDIHTDQVTEIDRMRTMLDDMSGL